MSPTKLILLLVCLTLPVTLGPLAVAEHTEEHPRRITLYHVETDLGEANAFTDTKTISIPAHRADTFQFGITCSDDAYGWLTLTSEDKSVRVSGTSVTLYYAQQQCSLGAPGKGHSRFLPPGDYTLEWGAVGSGAVMFDLTALEV